MRKPRYYYEANFYHVMTQGDEKKFIFHSHRNKEKYIQYLKVNAFRNGVEIIAYCIMGNHAHVLLFCPELERLSKMMSQTNTSFGLYYTNKRQKVGHVFRERFRSESIYTKSHLICCIKYIHSNPIKANICHRANEYPYSSYKDFYNVDERTKEICGLTDDDIDSIIKNERTITRFLDDEYSKDDVNYAFEVCSKLFGNIIDKNEKTTQEYKFLKENCKITDDQIAKLMGISRASLFRRLKKCGLK